MLFGAAHADGSRSPRVLARAATTALMTFALVATGTTAALAIAPQSATPACAPCTYHVTPTGVGAQSLSYVLQHLVQSNDTVVLADGVYRVDNLQVSAPDVTIIAEHVPARGAEPTVWLDGSIPYRWWNHPSPTVWEHAYDEDFCNTTTPQLPCSQVSAPYHSDEVFMHGNSIPETLNPSDLDSAFPCFYVDRVHHQLLVNVDPGSDTEVTNLETALVFNRSAVHSTLEGIGVRRYAGNDHDPADLAMHQNAAVFVNDATGVAFRNDMFSFNAVRALKTQGDVPPAQTPVAGAGVFIDGSTFDHNGELGLNSNDSDDIVVQRSLFYRNALKGYPGYGEASGAKLLSTYGAHIIDDTFRANLGMGLWFDRSSYDATVAHDLFQENTWDGFKYEVSAHATVTDNIAVSNDRSGLLVYESSQVSLSHNYLRGNLIGIEVHEERRTLANTPSAHDSDHDRHHAARHHVQRQGHRHPFERLLLRTVQPHLGEVQSRVDRAVHARRLRVRHRGRGRSCAARRVGPRHHHDTRQLPHRRLAEQPAGRTGAGVHRNVAGAACLRERRRLRVRRVQFA